MNIITLDLGTKTGWALYQEDTNTVTSGTFSCKDSRWVGGGMKFVNFINFVKSLYGKCQGSETLVYYEEVRRHVGVDAAHAYGGFHAFLIAWADQNTIPYEAVPVSTIKKHITGKGNAKKKEIIEAVNQKYNLRVKDDNEADAIAMMGVVLELHNKTATFL
jgi:Holliday junction resolvasome RuvABC endonuclease subunit